MFQSLKSGMEFNILNFHRIQSGWKKTLFIVFFAQFITALGFSSIFPFLPLYVESLGSKYGFSIEFLAGMVFSFQAFMMMIAAPIWGSLADRFGRKLMVERSLFGSAIALFLMAFVHSGEALVLLRGLQGLISGTMAAANALVAAEVPRKRTGYAMGLLQVGFGGGIALGPFIGGVIADWYGYSSAFLVTTVLLLIAGFIVLFGVKENFQEQNELPRGKEGVIKEWGTILRTSGVWVTYGLRFLTSLGRMIIVPVVPLFVLTLLPDPGSVNTVTGAMMGVSYLTMTLSSMYFGRLGDKVGHRTIVIACAIAAGLFYIPQSFVNQAWQIVVLQGFVGIAVGGIMPTMSALLAQYTSAGEEGAVYGLDNSINSAARSIAPLLGAGIASFFTMRATFTVTGAVFLLAAVLAIAYLPSSAFEKVVPSHKPTS